MNAKAGAAVAALLLLTLAVFLPVRGHEFLVFDDDLYVTANPAVAGGLSAQGVRWAWTSVGYASNWHPLTWISHMADVQLFGLDAGRHHLVNLLLHLAATALLALFLRSLTGVFWPGLLVAALFALHPLHVESVAWVAERKDVLSAVFWMLSLAAYLRFVRRPAAGAYVLLLVVYALGLSAKPMLVSLPLVLLLLDFWPLGRLRLPAAVLAGPRNASGAAALVVEKLPLLALAAASAAITVVAQGRGEALKSEIAFPMAGRVANAFAVLGAYLLKAVYPVGLAAYYPAPPEGPPLWQAAAGLLLLVGATAAALRLARRAPYVLTGWLWYLATLAPVIGVVKVGSQAMADRYTYLPLLGPFLAASWGLGALRGRARPLVGALALAVPLLLAPLTRAQVLVWKSDLTLFSHAREVVGASALVEYNIAYSLAKAGRFEESRPYLERCLAIDPANGRAHDLLGLVLLRAGRNDEAIAHFALAIRHAPREALAYNNMASALFGKGRPEEARGYAEQALGLDPSFFEARYNLGLLAIRLGRWDEAAHHLREAQRLRPGFAEIGARLREVDARRRGL